MKKIQEIIFHPGGKEEILPDFMPDFPYIASWVESDRYMGCFAPWHWHKAVELFYIENGTLEYHTPEGKILFSKGSGGMVNSNILHMTKVASQTRQTTQLLHQGTRAVETVQDIDNLLAIHIVRGQDFARQPFLSTHITAIWQTTSP